MRFRRASREPVHDPKVCLQKLELGKSVEGIPLLALTVPILINPELSVLAPLSLLGNVIVYEADFLGTNVLDDIAGYEGHWLRCTIATKTYVKNVLLAGWKSNNVDEVDPRHMSTHLPLTQIEEIATSR